MIEAGIEPATIRSSAERSANNMKKANKKDENDSMAKKPSSTKIGEQSEAQKSMEASFKDY